MKLNDFLKQMFTWGTPACGLFCGVCGIVVAVLMLTVGFWKTLLVVALAAIGGFVGGVKDKPGSVKNTINHVFPPKDEFDE